MDVDKLQTNWLPKQTLYFYYRQPVEKSKLCYTTTDAMTQMLASEFIRFKPAS